MDTEWPIRLFNKSVLKQQKYNQITALLGQTAGRRCLDVGSDNGVISYLLRRRGGTWASADLDARSVESIRALVEEDVYQIEEAKTSFPDDTFDCVILVDFLEHIEDDAGFVQELHRILKPHGTLIVNVPHIKTGFLRWLRQTIGQTDEEHGHVRPGYTIDSLRRVLGKYFVLDEYSTYSKFFSELIDILIVVAVSTIRSGREPASQKGLIVTDTDLEKYRSMFRIYAFIYPIVWFFSKLDSLIFFASGYMLIAKAHAVATLPAQLGTVGAETSPRSQSGVVAE